MNLWDFLQSSEKIVRNMLRNRFALFSATICPKKEGLKKGALP
jgi:hypothetical protein